MVFKLEICADSVESALIAQSSGAARVELCDNLMEGGTTPSYGTILTARQSLSIGLNVLIRPRPGDFLYSDAEFDIMKKEISFCREAGADGVVTGLLCSNGSVDIERTAELVQLAKPMEVTFHRAFDLCNDPFSGLEDIISTGAVRLLTSGQQQTAENGMDLISELVRIAGSRLIIMPGSGINEDNIGKIAKGTKAFEFHMSGRRVVQSAMIYKKENISMGGLPGYSEYVRKTADPVKIEKVLSILLSAKE
jgi:copper homeostasis protein